MSSVLSINYATAAEAQLGISTVKSINPLTLKQAISAALVRRSNFRYIVPVGTVAVGASAVAGADSYSRSLTADAVNTDVFLNGSHLTNTLDYDIVSWDLITLNTTLCANDVLDIITYQII